MWYLIAFALEVCVDRLRILICGGLWCGYTVVFGCSLVGCLCMLWWLDFLWVVSALWLLVLLLVIG